MKTILELIESWKPCERYKEYRDRGLLTPESTLESILYSHYILSHDKQWFFNNLLNTHRPLNIHVMVHINSAGISYLLKVCNTDNYEFDEHVYTYDHFLDMVYEYLEHVEIDAAI